MKYLSIFVLVFAAVVSSVNSNETVTSANSTENVTLDNTTENVSSVNGTETVTSVKNAENVTSVNRNETGTSVNSTAAVVQPEAVKKSVDLIKPKIIKKQGTPKSLFSDLGQAPIRSCGGAGRVLKYRSEGCTKLSDEGVCAFPAGRSFRGELSFIPSSNTESLGTRTFVNYPDRNPITWQDPFLNEGEPIEAGKEYALVGEAVLAPELRGKMITFQKQIYRESDNVVEVCMEADLLIV